MKITEKHYAPWVKARQEQLEADVRRTWEGQQSGEIAKPKPTYKSSKENVLMPSASSAKG